MGKLIALAAIALTACAANLPGMPGSITEERSEFDGGTIVNLQPANAGAYGLAMGAQWRSSAPDMVLIVVNWLGDPVSIADHAGLEFNVDGKVLQLDSIGLPTRFQIDRGAGYSLYTTSAKAFSIRREDFQGLLRAGSLKARINTSAGGIEADMLRQDMPMSAIHGFREFATHLR